MASSSRVAAFSRARRSARAASQVRLVDDRRHGDLPAGVGLCCHPLLLSHHTDRGPLLGGDGRRAANSSPRRAAVSSTFASRCWRRSWAASSTALWRHSRGPVHAGDEAAAVDPAQVAVHERVARLGPVRGALGEPEVPGRVLLPRVRLEVGVLVSALRLRPRPSRSRARTAGRRSAAGRWPPRPR